MNAELTKERDLMHGKRVMILSVRYVSKSTLKEWEFEVMHDGITRKVRGFIETYRLFSYAGYPISDSPTIRNFTPALAGIVEVDDIRNALRIKEIYHSGKVYKEEDAPVRGGKAAKTQVATENAPSTPLAPIPSTLDEKLNLLHQLANEVFVELDASKMQNPTWGKSLIAAQIVQLSKSLLPKG